MTLPSFTTASATPGIFHSSIAFAARSSMPRSCSAGSTAAGVAATAFFLFCAKAGVQKRQAIENTSSNLRIVIAPSATYRRKQPIQVSVRDCDAHRVFAQGLLTRGQLLDSLAANFVADARPRG